MFIIKWTCLNSSRTVQSVDTYSTQGEAQEIADSLNEEYPTIAHYVVESTDNER